MREKTCSQCKLSKSIFQFNTKAASRDGHRPECQACQKIEMDRYIAKHGPGVISKRAREAHKLRKFDLTIEQFTALLDKQQHCCGICYEKLNPEGQNTQIDHAHLPDENGQAYHKRVKGPVRGILCRACNSGLGHFRDDPARLRAALDYLERSSAPVEMWVNRGGPNK